MWKQYFGPYSVIVGLDIDPVCQQVAEDQIHIRIGNQSDTDFLQRVLDEFGTPDIIIDDGSHMMQDMRKSFLYLYRRLPDNGVYIVEDMHTCYWPDFGGGYRAEGSFMEFCKGHIDLLNAHHTKGRLKPTEFTDSTFSVCFYDSVVVFEKRKRASRLKSVTTGTIQNQ